MSENMKGELYKLTFCPEQPGRKLLQLNTVTKLTTTTKRKSQLVKEDDHVGTDRKT